MAEIVNLRRTRKARKRSEDQERAAENRALHGLTRAEKAAEKSRRDAAGRHVDGHRRETDDES
ncbi:DUF4169 family protein [Amorphus coralli]|uniref:DUF4169 family protein n=1 Tax=Amorphus coralli TaxID=340680 RepID=UPI0003616E62|nr:DUF4169 family protein [Amorphus coralli]